MKDKLSRRKLAQYVADTLVAGVEASVVLREVAAYLIDSGRLRETELVIRAIEDALADRGIVLARVTTATDLTATLRRDIEEMINARQVTLDTTIDPSVIGGVRIEIPGKVLDATVQRKLLALRQAKV
jgi:F-type H+-transporting ATPase subunit delta